MACSASIERRDHSSFAERGTSFVALFINHISIATHELPRFLRDQLNSVPVREPDEYFQFAKFEIDNATSLQKLFREYWSKRPVRAALRLGVLA
jgi:hypothetical protein